MVRSIVPYIVFLVLGMAVFIFFTVTTETDILETFDGTCTGSKIVINDSIGEYKYVYVYKDRGSKTMKADIVKTECVDGLFTVIEIADRVDYDMEGPIKADLPVRKTNLLRLLLHLDSKQVEKNIIY